MTAPARAAADPAVRRLARHATGWPEGLEHLDLPPAALWIRGPYPLDRPSVAVVGARDATLAGLEVARRLAADLATAGIPVVSGMALGIDAAAHQGALAEQGTTVAVLGCGIDVCYPSRHRELRERIAATGVVLTEEPPGTQPLPFRFPRRNRIIAALADAVVVVEASDRSGALSTARHAADLGREVFAVPGSVLSERSAGANRLLRDGAAPLTETLDLAAVPSLADRLHAARGRLRLQAAAFAPRAGGGTNGDNPPRPRDPAAAAILGRLGPDPVHPDALGAALGLSPSRLAAQLAELELAGHLHTLAGGLVARAPEERCRARTRRDAPAGPAAHTAATAPPGRPATPAEEHG